MKKYITIIGCSLSLAHQGGAATLNWDAGNPTGDGAITSGNGTWSSSTTNFSNATGTTNDPYIDGQDLCFADIGGVVTLTDSFSPTSIAFIASDYTLISGDIAAGLDTTGGLSIDVLNAGDRAVINVPITGSGNLTVGGNGTLVTGINVIGDNVNLINTGTLELEGAETVNTYTSTDATVNGISVLTARTYDLTDSVVNLGLGTGTINTNGQVDLNFLTLGNLNVQTGTTNLVGVNQGTVNISNGATLIAELDTLNITGNVNNAGNLTLAGDQTVGAYSSTGTLDGPGTLTADRFDLNGGTIVNADLGPGTITTEGAVQINGTSAGDLNVDSGTTILAGANSGDVSLDRGATLIAQTDTLFEGGTVRNTDATLTLNGDQTILNYISTGEANVNGDIFATLNGVGTLTSETYTLNDRSIISTNLGLGEITSNGIVQIAGEVAGNISVETGTTVLTNLLSGDLSIADGATVTAAGGTLGSQTNLTNEGILSLLGEETILSYTSTGGEISGPGTFNADTYNINDGSVVNIQLGEGDIITNGSIELNQTTAGDIQVQTGTTVLAAANTGSTLSIDEGATLEAGSQTLDAGTSVTNAGTLTLSDNETVQSYTASGLLNGSGTLTAGEYNLNDGTQVNLALGAGQITTNGAVALNQITAGDLLVESGTTTLSAQNSGSNIDINNGGTLTAAANTLDSNATVTNSGSFNLLGNQTISNYQGSNGTLQGTGVLNTGDFTAGNIETTLLAGANLSLSVDTPTATLGAGSQITLSGASSNISVLDEYNLFQGSPVITGDATSIGFEIFDVSGLAPDVNAVFNVQTGNLLVFESANSNLDPSSQATLNAILGIAADNEDRITNVDGLSLDTQDTIDQINSAVSSSSSITINNQLQELSPSFYASLADYSAYQHLNYKKQLESNPYLIRSKQWELVVGFQHQSLEKDASSDNVEYKLEGSGAYLGIYNQLSESVRVGIYGAYDKGEISSSLADFDTDGIMLGIRAEYETYYYGTFSVGVSAGSFEFDGVRRAQGIPNVASGIDSSTLDFELGYKLNLYNEDTYTVSAFASVNHIMTEVDGFSESGSRNSLTVSDYSKDLTLATIGAEGVWRPTEGPFGFLGSIAYTKNSAESNNDLSASFSNGTDFSVSANGITGDLVETQIGAFYNISEHTIVDLTYFSNSADDADSSNGVNLSLRYHW